MADKPQNAPKVQAAARDNRAAAFEAGVLLHLDSAYTLARYLSRRTDIAEDLVQDALLRAYRSFEESRCSNPRAWLLAIVRNCFLTWKARAGEERQVEVEGRGIPVPDGAGQDHEQETPESVLIRKEDDCAMRSLIEALPDPFREALVLRDIEDMSYRDIADITGVPIGTVMSRLARARNMLAAAYKGSLIEPSAESSR